MTFTFQTFLAVIHTMKYILHCDPSCVGVCTCIHKLKQNIRKVLSAHILLTLSPHSGDVTWRLRLASSESILLSMNYL